MKYTLARLNAFFILQAVCIIGLSSGCVAGNTRYHFSTLAGKREYPGFAEGRGSQARFNAPQRIAVDANGNIYVADLYNRRIRRVTKNGKVSTYVGAERKLGPERYPDAHRKEVFLRAPTALLLDEQGNLYFTDGPSLRMVGTDGMVRTIAGNIMRSGHADGPGNVALFGSLWGMAFDHDGNILIADVSNNTIRKVAPDGAVSTLTSMPKQGASGADSGGVNSAGDKKNVYIERARDVCVASNGDIYVAGRHHIYRISDDNTVTAVVELELPFGIALDEADNIFVADGNRTIVRITPDGEMSIIGGRKHSFGPVMGVPIRVSRNGIGRFARFYLPWGITVDKDGVLYITDSNDHAIRVGRPIKWLP